MQDQCHEFRSLVKEGRLICTRENNPVRDSYGRMHVNKCAMCQSILYVKMFINYFDIFTFLTESISFSFKMKGFCCHMLTIVIAPHRKFSKHLLRNVYIDDLIHN